MAFGGIRGTLQVAVNSVLNPTVATGSVSVQAGDLVYALMVQQTALNATTCIDNLGNTYTALNAGTLSGSAVSGRAYWARVAANGTLTSVSIGATASGNNAAVIAVAIEGPFSSSQPDANPANITSDITSPFTCPTTGTLSQADEVVVAWGAANYSTVWTATSPNTLRVELATQAVAKGIIGSQTVAATTAVVPVFAAAGNPTAAVLGTSSFKAASAQTLTPSLFTSGTAAFPAPTVTTSVTVTVSLFNSGALASFPAPTVSPGEVTVAPPALYTDADSIFAPVVAATYPVAGSFWENQSTFYAPTVLLEQLVAPTLFDDADSFPAPTLSADGAPQELSPGLFENAGAFYAPLVAAEGEDLVGPALFENANAFYVPAIVGEGTIAPNLFLDADEFFAPTLSVVVGPSHQIVALVAWANSSMIHQPYLSAPGREPTYDYPLRGGSLKADYGKGERRSRLTRRR